MDITDLIIGVVAGILLTRAWRWIQAQAEAEPGDESGTPQPPIEGETLGPEPLAERLHNLDDEIVQFANNAAHPREMLDHRPFQDARDLLVASDTPLQTVVDYALGANWTLSCVGLAALAHRPDRHGVTDRVVEHCGRLVPWAMYFALDYLNTVQPKAPIGAPLLGAKDWWVDVIVLPSVFREYFEKRAGTGELPDFGPGLTAGTAAPPNVIAAFLQTIDHPTAIELIAELQAIQRTAVDREFLATFGRFWERDAKARALVEPDAWQDAFRAGGGDAQPDTGKIAARQRRAAFRQDILSAPARRSARRQCGLAGVRGERTRPSGRTAMDRPARGAHPAHAR